MINKLRATSASLLAFVSLLAAVPATAAGPGISAVSYPYGVTANSAAVLSVNVTSAAGTKSCNLYVDSEDMGSMALNGQTASRSHVFPRGGVFTVFVFCRDNAGGMASGPNTSIFVQGPIVQTPAYSGTAPASPAPPASVTTTGVLGPAAGSLIKLDCPADAAADHPCKAVYYLGKDGKRHAFPNDKAYFTWYQDFGSVTSVSLTALGAIPLGKNVTYRPGARLVKFTTLNKVYAVAKGGVLRWVASEAVAQATFGSDWSTKIDDIADTFYANYAFGQDIAQPADYVVAQQLDSAKSIDESL